MSAFEPMSRLFPAAFLLLSLTGCFNEEGDTNLTRVEESIAWGSVTFNVLDARTRAPLEGAGIGFIDGPALTSREDGTIRVDSIGVGSHLVRVSLPGYETGEEEVRIADSGGQGARAQAFVKTILLHKKGVSLKGKVLVRSKDGKEDMRAGKNVVVELRLGNNFQNVYRTATSSESGEFTFTDLPEFAACTLSIEPLTLDGDRYKLRSRSVIPANLVAASVYPVPASILEFSQDGSLLLLSPLELRPQQGEKLSISFSNSIDTTEIPANALTLYSNNVPVAISYAWEEDNTVLSIRPFQGDWPFGGSLVLQLSGLKDESQRLLRGPDGETTLNILVKPEPTEGGLGSVDSIWVKSRIFLPESQTFVDTNVMDYSLPNYSLVWRKVREASQYEVYTRETPSDLWTLSGVADRDTTFLFTAPQNANTNKVMTRQHLVLARNAGMRGDISKATIFDCRDGMGPIWGSSSQISKVSPFESFDNRGNASSKTVLLRLVLRDQSGANLEALDRGRGPRITVEEGYDNSFSGDWNYRPEVSGFTWVSGNVALIEMVIEPFKDGRYDNLVLELEGMQDLAGNPLSGVFGQTKIIFQTF